METASSVDKDPETDNMVMTLFSENHCKSLHDNIYMNFTDGLFSDITICVDHKQFKCHKVILAAGANYFRSMFMSGMMESHSDSITMKELDADVFTQTLQFLYTGSITMTIETVSELYRQGNILQIYPLVELCTLFFTKNINLKNCIGILMQADAYMYKPLFDVTTAFVCKNFSNCCANEEFLQLSVNCIVTLLRDRNLNCADEDIVYKTAVKWLDYDAANRSTYRVKVLECVKYPLLTQSYLMDIVIKSPIIHEDENLNEIIEDAVTFHTIPSRRSMVNPYQVTPRYSFPFFEAAVLLGGRHSEGLRNNVEYYRPDTREFVPLKTLPFKKRNEFAVCSVGNEIYVSGGLRSAEFWKYDTTFDTWLSGAPLKYARRRHAMVSVDDTIYVLGGFDEENVLGSVEKWNKQTTKWEECGNLVLPVENMGSVTYAQRIYLFGGKNNDEAVTNSIQYFDSVTLTCTMLQKTLPAHDMCVSAVVLHHRIYVVGLEGAFQFDPVTENWQLLPENNFPRDFISLAVLEEKLYAIGGRRRGSKENLYSDCLEAYDFKTNHWTIISTLPTPMYCYGCTKVYLSERATIPEENEELDQLEGL